MLSAPGLPNAAWLYSPSESGRKSLEANRLGTRSHTALLSLVQALAYAVYAGDEAAFAERIRAYKLK